MPAGSKWLEEIDQALAAAVVLLVLCSPASLRRPWINFETGCGWIKRVPCHSYLSFWANEGRVTISYLNVSDIGNQCTEFCP